MTNCQGKRKGIHYTHRILWQACKRQQEISEQERRGSSYYRMTAMLMAFLSFEAYLNFVGEIVCPEEWENERLFFKGKSGYAGVMGKLELIAKRCNICINKKARPYQTMVSLKMLRNSLSHAKPEKYEEPYRGEDFPLIRESSLKNLISPDKMQRAMEDTKTLCDLIHERAKGIYGDTELGSDALEGYLSFEIGDVSLEG